MRVAGVEYFVLQLAVPSPRSAGLDCAHGSFGNFTDIINKIYYWRTEVMHEDQQALKKNIYYQPWKILIFFIY